MNEVSPESAKGEEIRGTVQQELSEKRLWESTKASLLKWSTALPAFSFLLACVSENAFFGKHPLWELLRGTGEGGN